MQVQTPCLYGKEPQVSPLRYTPVEMTILLGNEDESSQTNLSSRPERSVVERSAVPLSGLYADSRGPGTASVKAHD
jgi:hypothetical protein